MILIAYVVGIVFQLVSFSLSHGYIQLFLQIAGAVSILAIAVYNRDSLLFYGQLFVSFAYVVAFFRQKHKKPV